MGDTGEQLSAGRQVAYGTMGVLGSGALVEALVRSGVITAPGFPVPSKVVGALHTLLGDGSFWSEVGFTLRDWMLALLLATVAGTIVGGLMGAFRRMFIAFELPVEVFRVLPSVALGPILMLLIGTGLFPLSLTVALACFWPILLNTMYGVRGTDPIAVQTARTFGSSPLDILIRIKLPSALPFAFTGVRVAASIGLIVAVSSELLIGNGRGIGGFILTRTAQSADLDIVYAATLMAGLMGIAISTLFAIVDRAVFGWKAGLAQ